jgi:hypothetical protein
MLAGRGCNTMLLSSILISDDARAPAELSPTVTENIRSFRGVYPSFEHRLFDRAQCREIIAKDFDKEVLACFDKLKPGAYQSDLARMCILHSHGGVYADLSVYFFARWPPADSGADLAAVRKLAVFRDFCGVAPWQVANTVIFAPPRHRAIEKAIDLICINVKNEFYGCSSLSPTGPDPFGRAIALSAAPEDLITGDSLFMLPEFAPGASRVITEASHCFVFMDQLVAAKRKRGEGLAELGISGGNNYTAMWLARDVYRTS